jgi:hypothetical protein
MAFIVIGGVIIAAVALIGFIVWKLRGKKQKNPAP